MGLSFGEPGVLLFLLLAVPALLYLYRLYLTKRKASAIKFSSLGTIKETSFSAKARNIVVRMHLPFILITLAIAALIIGLADPRIPLKTAKEGVNVVLVIDDSGSMSATDYSPTRLEAAKTAARTLISALKPKDNVGIVVFESGATTAAYLTPFKEKATQKLKAIEQKQGMTALGDGLSLAVDMAISIPNKKKVIVLLSDGVNNAGVVSPQESAQFAKANKIQVNTVGLGSEKPVVLGYDFFGNPQYAELDEQTLKNIASETGGTYYKSVNKNTLDEIYSRVGAEIEREWEDTSIKDWLFIAALVALLADAYVVYGRYKIVV